MSKSQILLSPPDCFLCLCWGQASCPMSATCVDQNVNTVWVIQYFEWLWNTQNSKILALPSWLFPHSALMMMMSLRSFTQNAVWPRNVYSILGPSDSTELVSATCAAQNIVWVIHNTFNFEPSGNPHVRHRKERHVVLPLSPSKESLQPWTLILWYQLQGIIPWVYHLISAPGYKRGLDHSHNQCLGPEIGVKKHTSYLSFHLHRHPCGWNILHPKHVIFDKSINKGIIRWGYKRGLGHSHNQCSFKTPMELFWVTENVVWNTKHWTFNTLHC